MILTALLIIVLVLDIDLGGRGDQTLRDDHSFVHRLGPMAIDFDTGDYLEATSGLNVGNGPFTISAWHRFDSAIDGSMVMVSTGFHTGSTWYRRDLISYPNNDWVFASEVGADSGFALHDEEFPADTWIHALAIFAGAADRRTVVNAQTPVLNVVNITPSTMDTLTIGRAVSNGNQFRGHLGEVAIYSGTLETSSYVNLAKRRYSPLLVESSKLLHYFRFGSNYTDEIGGVTLTPNGTPTFVDHVPGIVYSLNSRPDAFRPHNAGRSFSNRPHLASRPHRKLSLS